MKTVGIPQVVSKDFWGHLLLYLYFNDRQWQWIGDNVPREPNILDPFVRPYGDWQIGTDVKIPYLTITAKERKKKVTKLFCIFFTFFNNLTTYYYNRAWISVGVCPSFTENLFTLS